MRAAGMLYTITFISALLATQNFSVPKPGKPVEEEQHYRLLSIFAKNKYGYNTRFMSDFEQFLEAVLNEPFLDNSTAYYQDELTATEVEDMESGLAGEFAPADVQQLLHDVEEHDRKVAQVGAKQRLRAVRYDGLNRHAWRAQCDECDVHSARHNCAACVPVRCYV